MGVGGTGGSGGPFEGDGCVNFNVGFEGRTPTVMLLVDQSGSMNDKFPAGSQTSRWSVLYNALMDPTTGAVKAMEGSVRMGLAMYRKRPRKPQWRNLPAAQPGPDRDQQLHADQHGVPERDAW